MESTHGNWQAGSVEQSRRDSRSSLPRVQMHDHPSAYLPQSSQTNNRFSYTRTPAMAQEGFDEPSRTERPYTYIDEDPMSPEISHEASAPSPLPDIFPSVVTSNRQHPIVQTPVASMSPYSDDTRGAEWRSTGHQPSGPLPSEIHPTLLSPHDEITSTRIHSQHPQSPSDMTSPSVSEAQYNHPVNILATPTFSDPRTPPPMTYPPMPQSPHYRSTDTKDTKPTIDTNAPSTGLDFYHPDQNIFSNPAVPGSPRAAFTPTTPSDPLGPNASAFHLGHRPGQIAHPLSAAPKTWHGSTLTPSGTCLGALVCPCLAYGKVQHRLAQRSKKAEATDLLGYSAVNSDCGLFAALCGLCGVLATVQRTRTRRAYGIEGGVGGDCIRGCCCCCCTVALNEREIAHREEERRKLAGPVTTQYTSTGRMAYPS